MYFRKENINLCSFSIPLGIKNIFSKPVKNETNFDMLHNITWSHDSPSSKYVSNLEDSW